MRISDWSSDVCSSDLGYEVKSVEVVPATTAGTQKLPIAVSNFKAAGVDFVIVAANVVLNGPFVQTAGRSGFNPEYSLSDFNNQINDQVSSYYPDSFDGTIGLSTHRFPEHRSEEHTSELQSLMRISYAVLCLKKNKKH